MPDGSPPRELCCEGSLEAGELLTATAPRTDTWLLLEYNAAWGGKALPESDLPSEVKQFIDDQIAAIPNGRFQFIKQERHSTDRDGIRLYVARSRPANPTLYRFDLTRYDDLLSLDIAAVAGGAADYDGYQSSEALFLVCTNGKRDLSCARYGLPLYRAMRAVGGESVWQTIHIGGHRFAGTLVCLPEGLYYGRVGTDDAEFLMRQHGSGRIDLAHYRGRSVYDAPVQAAEHFLRQQTGNTDIRGLEFVEAAPDGEQSWRVTAVLKGRRYNLRVTSRLSEFEIYESTANTEKNRVTLYGVEAYETRSMDSQTG